MASALLGVVALAVPLGWAALYRNVRFRDWFVPESDWAAFQVLLLPDLALALLTGAAAVVVRTDQRPLVGDARVCGWRVGIRDALHPFMDQPNGGTMGRAHRDLARTRRDHRLRQGRRFDW